MKKIITTLVAGISLLLSSTWVQASERAEQGWRLIEEGAKVVDVRTPQEFEQGHLDIAVNYPLQELAQHLDKLDKDEMIVLYCRSGARVESAMRFLRAQGFTKLHNAGGLVELEQTETNE